MHYTDLENLYEKHGGKFRVAVLLQRRVQQLVKGDKRLVSVQSDNPMDIAVAEARAGKIWLHESDEVKKKKDE